MRAPERTFGHARDLRRDMSLPEVILWDCLRARRLNGLRFRRHHPVGPYVIDFFCADGRLGVEVDGGHHDGPQQMTHDYRRDGWLGERGIRVMRIAAADILNERALEGILDMIADAASAPAVPLLEEFLSQPFSSSEMPPPPPSAVPLPRKRGRIGAADDLDLGSSPAKRGTGTAEGGGGGMSSLAKQGIDAADGRDLESSPAKRGRGTAEGGGGGMSSLAEQAIDAADGLDLGSSPAERWRGTAEGGGGGIPVVAGDGDGAHHADEPTPSKENRT